jgi:C1A family cysteine protease
MKALVALLLVALVAAETGRVFSNDNDYLFLFKSWMRQNSKEYEHDEFFHRFTTFMDNLDMIMTHNKKDLGWTMKMNVFGDMPWGEFRRTHLGLKPVTNSYYRNLNTAVLSNVDLPDSIDWVAKGGVTPVKNQGQCGSCWAFSTTGSIEGAGFVRYGILNSLSEQQLVDCASSYGNQGCSGGWMDNAFQYVIANHGLCSEYTYPYVAYDSTCKSTTCSALTTSAITGFKDVAVNDEVSLKSAVAMQPVSVAIEADQPGFQFYSSGVFDGYCGTQLDHGVLTVGYGTEGGKLFWKVKNSWGPSWGDGGYIKLVRKEASGPGQCGIAMAASFPTF